MVKAAEPLFPAGEVWSGYETNLLQKCSAIRSSLLCDWPHEPMDIVDINVLGSFEAVVEDLLL